MSSFFGNTKTPLPIEGCDTLTKVTLVLLQFLMESCDDPNMTFRYACTQYSIAKSKLSSDDIVNNTVNACFIIRANHVLRGLTISSTFPRELDINRWVVFRGKYSNEIRGLVLLSKKCLEYSDEEDSTLTDEDNTD